MHDAAVAVVVSAYRQPETLVLTLAALGRQTLRPGWVIVADDGSDAAIRDAARAAAAALPFPVMHVWQPDEGFRLARSRNNAVHAAPDAVRTLAFLDQDVLPGPEWLWAHRAALKPHTVCLGSTLELAVGAAEADRLRAAIASGGLAAMAPVRERIALSARQARARYQAVLRGWGWTKAHKPRLQGNNFSIHRDTLARVNGFDERFRGWGQEDDDFARRLYAAGVRPVPVHTRARAYHIRHASRREHAWRDGPNAARFREGDWVAVCREGLNAPRADVRVTPLTSSARTPDESAGSGR